MESYETNRSGVDLGSEALAEMVKYGIECARMNQFFYGGYRYTNLADAIAEAKRRPHAGSSLGPSQL